MRGHFSAFTVVCPRLRCFGDGYGMVLRVAVDEIVGSAPVRTGIVAAGQQPEQKDLDLARSLAKLRGWMYTSQKDFARLEI